MLKETPKKELNILRYPRLDTVIMVEKFIEDYSGEFKVYQLWKNLPKKVMYQTYKIILNEDQYKQIVEEYNFSNMPDVITKEIQEWIADNDIIAQALKE